MAFGGLASPAAAQSAPSGAPLDDIAPSFATLDRMDNASRVGVQVGFYKVDDVDIDDVFLMRFDLYGQYVIPGHKMGLYGQLPISRAFVFLDEGESATGVGNLDAGVYGLPLGGNDLILRAGLMLGIASDLSLIHI